MAEIEKLFTEFPPVNTEAWEAVITQDLKGGDYEKKLVWKTLDGLSVKPYYRAEDLQNLSNTESFPGSFPFVRGNKTDNNTWELRQDIKVENFAEANKKALDILNKGIDSVGFVFNDDFQLSLTELETLLKDICLTAIRVNFVAGHGVGVVLPVLAEYLKKHKYDAAKVAVTTSIDPLGIVVTDGRLCKPVPEVFEKVKSHINNAKELTAARVIAVNAKHFNNAGATIVQELAFGLAQGNEYLAQLTEKGLSIDEISPKLFFTFGVGPNYFMEIAKFRAARLLWSKIVKAYNPKNEESCKMFIHAETSMWNMTAYDPYVNMLRTTTEAMSAIISGIDSLTVLPFDAAYKTPNEFSERIARNQQIMLKEESSLDKVVDPSAGSYYIENLTTSIAEAAWKLFTEVEEKGGFIEAFRQDFIQKQVEETAKKRDMNIASRRETLLGTNQFPNNSEKILNNVENTPAKEDKRITCETIGRAVKLYRGAQAFEELRLKTEKSGRTVKAFMLTIGNLAMRKARASFACNFFACAGFQTTDNIGFATVEEGVKASLDAKADIVVICSSDDEYATLAPEIFEQLKNKAVVVIAGAPACTDELKAKGITNFISVKSNVLEELKNYQKLLNI